MHPQTKKFPRQRHFLAAFFISFMWGIFGIDRMYLGKWGTGILKLVTLGGLGVWALVDTASIMAGTMRDKQGREMLQVAEYKGFAFKLTLIFAVVVTVIVVLNGVVLVATISQFINGGIPGLDALNGLQGGGLTPEQMTELGI